MSLGGDFEQVRWDAVTEEACRRLVRSALDEDLRDGCDLTCEAVVPPRVTGCAFLVARQPGTVAGLPIIPLVLAELTQLGIRGGVEWQPQAADGDTVIGGATLGRFCGNARTLLAAERTVLNFVGRMSGIATQTRRYVDAVSAHRVRIYDTRKTVPGWRRPDKYAVRCGGGFNHRIGLHAAIMIKDNHLALAASLPGDSRQTPADAVHRAREFLARIPSRAPQGSLLEIELDRLQPLAEVLAARPDIVLLDNMSPQQLQDAVTLRDRTSPAVQLEASGGIHLQNIAVVAATGVDRISVGALTHSSPAWDVALDWE